MLPLIAQSLPFVHPALALAGGALALSPIVIHLLNRRRHRRVRWAAMRFLLAAQRQTRRRIQLEHFLLLLARVLLLLLLALAVARPYLSGTALARMVGGRTHHILLIDDSRSMQARSSGGQTRFERAKEAAMNLLGAIPDRDPISIITLAAPAKTLVEDSLYDRRLVRQRVVDLAVTQRGTDIAGACGLALQIASASQAELGAPLAYVISDTPANQLISDSSAPSPAAQAVERLAEVTSQPPSWIPITEKGAVANLAVTQLAPSAGLVGASRPTAMRAEVSNFGERQVDGVRLQVEQNGEVVRRLDVPRLAGGRSVLVPFSLVFDGPGTQSVEVRLTGFAGDMLAQDDSRACAVEVRSALRAVLVDGRRGATRYDGQAGFVATALSPQTGRRAGRLIDIQFVDELELSDERLLHTDLLALCNVPRLSGDRWRSVRDFVQTGGALLVFPGDLVDAANYQHAGEHSASRSESDAGDSAHGFWPARLGDASIEPAAPTTLSRADLRHPLIAPFADLPTSGLFQVDVSQYWPLTEPPADAEVVLRFESGDIALAMKPVGRGCVVLFALPANMTWSNLPAKGDFVSLLASVVRRVSVGQREPRNVAVGEMMQQRLQPGQQNLPLRVIAQTGRSFEPDILTDARGFLARWGPIEHPGLLELELGATEWHFAATADNAESALRSAHEEALRSAVDGKLRWIFPNALESASLRGGRSELAGWLLYALLGLVFVESWLAMRFSAERRAETADPSPAESTARPRRGRHVA